MRTQARRHTQAHAGTRRHTQAHAGIHSNIQHHYTHVEALLIHNNSTHLLSAHFTHFTLLLSSSALSSTTIHPAASMQWNDSGPEYREGHCCAPPTKLLSCLSCPTTTSQRYISYLNLFFNLMLTLSYYFVCVGQWKEIVPYLYMNFKTQSRDKKRSMLVLLRDLVNCLPRLPPVLFIHLRDILIAGFVDLDFNVWRERFREVTLLTMVIGEVHCFSISMPILSQSGY